MLLVEALILLMHLAHFLDLVEVDNEAGFVSVVLLDAFPTENCQVVRAVKMLYSLVVLLAYQTVYALLVLKINISQYGVPLYELVENIEIEGQLVDGLDAFHELAANRAPHPLVVVQD